MLNFYNLGTTGFTAPEILQRLPYEGPGVDIFSLGVILFTMFVGCRPFNEAKPNDFRYKFICQNEAHKFWLYHSLVS
jgi:serine/threonine protein kinase